MTGSLTTDVLARCRLDTAIKSGGVFLSGLGTRLGLLEGGEDADGGGLGQRNVVTIGKDRGA